MHEDAELYEAAELYYVQRATMDAVADRFRVSRSTVSRMLQAARDRGIVRVSLSEPVNPGSEVSRTLQKAFGVTAHVAGSSPSASDAKRLDAVARSAAALIGDWVGDEMTLAVAWGATTSAVASHLQPKPTRDATVVQMNGAVSSRSPQMGSPGLLSQMAAAFDASLVPFSALPTGEATVFRLKRRGQERGWRLQARLGKAQPNSSAISGGALPVGAKPAIASGDQQCAGSRAATLSPLLRRLETAGLITRRRVPGNERALAVELTAASSALRAEALSVPETTMRRFGLNRQDVMQLHAAD